MGKRGGNVAWLWVRENGPFSGSHVHILMHVPAGAEIGRMFRSWIKRVSNQPYKRNTVKTTRVAGRANSATITPALYPEPGGRARICPEGLLQRSGGDAGIGKHQRSEEHTSAIQPIMRT